MAAEDTLLVFTPQHNIPPATNYATLDLRNGHPVLDFDKTTDEDAIFSGVLPERYEGGGLEVTIVWSATTVTTGVVRWNAAFERLAENDLDIDGDSFAAAQAADGNVNGTTGKLTYTTIPFTDGAQIDSLLKNELFRLKITRDANHANDTADNDAEVHAVIIKEAA